LIERGLLLGSLVLVVSPIIDFVSAIPDFGLEISLPRSVEACSGVREEESRTVNVVDTLYPDPDPNPVPAERPCNG
jgi:hypothetical protein